MIRKETRRSDAKGSDEGDFQWGMKAKYDVGTETGIVQSRQRHARAAGDHDEVRRLQEGEAWLWKRLDRVAGPDPKAVMEGLGLPDIDLPAGFYSVDANGEIRSPEDRRRDGHR